MVLDAKEINLGFIGCGNMANAIINAIKTCYYYGEDIEDECIDKFKYKISVFDSNEKNMTEIKHKFDDIILATNNNELTKTCDYIILAVKPDVYKKVLQEIGQNLTQDTVLISIMAGVKTSLILPYVKCNIVRTMPNLAASIGGSMTAVVKNNLVDEKKEVVEDILSKIGFFEYLDEDLMDAATAISGSGPAYVFKFIDGMVKAGVKLGLSEIQALNLTTQTVAASAGMCMLNEMQKTTCLERIDAVSSKGGTTIEAMNVFKNEKLDSIIEKAVFAAYNKSRKLSKELE